MSIPLCSKRSFPLHWLYVQHFLHDNKSQSTRQMKITSCAISFIHCKRVCNKIFSFFNQLHLQISSSCTRSVTVFLLILTLANSCFFSGHKTSCIFIIHLFTNSPSLNGRADFVIFSVTIKLTLTAASLCDFALVKKKFYCIVRFLFNLSTFCFFCWAEKYLYLSWCFIS